jgi:reductive dehalogenase
MGNAMVNPFLGARFKASVVTTDLPLMPDKPIDFGLQEFCRVCKKCAIECQSHAIPEGNKVMYNGYECWKLDVERCTKFRVGNQQGSSCGTCIKVCPWNKPNGWVHDAVRWMVKNASVFDGLVVKMDDLFGYGKQDIRKKWWFDMELVGNVLKRPGESSKIEKSGKSATERPAAW